MILAAGLIPHPDAKPPATGDTVADAIEEGRRWDRIAPAESVTLHFDDGIVRLSGVVPGVLVKEPDETGQPHAYPTARRSLLQAVESALQRERAVESGVVTVTAARDGSVALTGDVRSPQEKRRAGEVAAAVRGVTVLDNRLSVAAAAERPDPAIEADIEGRLKDDPMVDPAFIRVVVANGMVTLTGAVGTAAAKRRAVEDAWVAGVRHVEASKLTVKDWARKSKQMPGKWAAGAGPKEEATIQRAELPTVPPAIRNFLQ